MKKKRFAIIGLIILMLLTATFSYVSAATSCPVCTSTDITHYNTRVINDTGCCGGGPSCSYYGNEPGMDACWAFRTRTWYQWTCNNNICWHVWEEYIGISINHTSDVCPPGP